MKNNKTAYLNKWLRVVRLESSRCLCLALIVGLLLRLSAAASGTLTLDWNPSADPRVTGYTLYYGGASGVYTDSIVVGNTTNFTVSGLVVGLTYCFAVTSFTASGLESAFSDPIVRQVPLQTILRLQMTRVQGIPVSVTISASGVIPNQWTLQSSTNLKTWTTVARGTNLAINVLLPFNRLPAQFFRLLGQ
jgi:hypothetical protein